MSIFHYFFFSFENKHTQIKLDVKNKNPQNPNLKQFSLNLP